MPNIAQTLLSNVIEKIDSTSSKSQHHISIGLEGLGYLKRGDLSVVSARPGSELHAFCLNIVKHIALRLNKKVMIFTSSKPANEIVLDLLVITGKISKFRIQYGDIDFDTWEKLKLAEEKLSKANILIEYAQGKGPKILAEKLNNYLCNSNEFGLILVLDDPNIIESLNEIKGAKHATATTCQAYQKLARKFNVPILLTSAEQITVNSPHEKRPLLTDYPFKAGLSFIDRVMYLRLDEVSDNKLFGNVGVEVIASTKRNHEHVIVPLTFNKDTLLFDNIAWWSMDD